MGKRQGARTEPLLLLPHPRCFWRAEGRAGFMVCMRIGGDRTRTRFPEFETESTLSQLSRLLGRIPGCSLVGCASCVEFKQQRRSFQKPFLRRSSPAILPVLARAGRRDTGRRRSDNVIPPPVVLTVPQPAMRQPVASLVQRAIRSEAGAEQAACSGLRARSPFSGVRCGQPISFSSGRRDGAVAG